MTINAVIVGSGVNWVAFKPVKGESSDWQTMIRVMGEKAVEKCKGERGSLWRLTIDRNGCVRRIERGYPVKS